MRLSLFFITCCVAKTGVTSQDSDETSNISTTRSLNKLSKITSNIFSSTAYTIYPSIYNSFNDPISTPFIALVFLS